MKMTVLRGLVAVAVLFGLLSTGLGKAMRFEKLHSRPMSAPIWSGDPHPSILIGWLS